MKDGDAKIGLETQMEAGKCGVKRDWRVCVSCEQYSGRRSKRVEKIYYVSDAGISDFFTRTNGGLQYTGQHCCDTDTELVFTL